MSLYLISDDQLRNIVLLAQNGVKLGKPIHSGNEKLLNAMMQVYAQKIPEWASFSHRVNLFKTVIGLNCNLINGRRYRNET